MIPEFIERARAAVDFAGRQVRRLVEARPDFFPLYTAGGRWSHSGQAWTNWCEGFLGGQLWLLHEATGDEWWRGKAEHYCRLVEHRKDDRDVHDLGFLFWPTWKKWYDLSGDPAANDVVVAAGRTLALRFREKGAYLCSFVGPQSLFIDIMMNVGIIFYAAGECGDAELRRIADAHCLTTRRRLVRGDGSTAHEGVFDAESGEFIRQSTHQGWRGDSCWARGQAWALYGFARAHELTGDGRYLDTAQRCADYFVENAPDHGVPPNDFDEPAPALPYESSAAAIAASGMLDLARLTKDPGRARRYEEWSLRTLGTLMGPEFLADGTSAWEGVLRHGIYHQRKGLGVDESTMWGDYFFLEALTKALSSGGRRAGET
jgi:unsaturated chondroitin disaccharide hydrolase